MPWGRLDDSLYDHPKLDRIPADRRLEAVGLWARSISWSNRFLTDGRIPRARIERLDGTLELADLLVTSGLFEDTGDGYLVHDFLEFNDSRVDVEKRRKADAERKAAWRDKKRHGGTDNGTSDAVEHEVLPGVTPGQPDDVSQRDSRARDVARIPSRPVPSRPSRGTSRSGTVRARNGTGPTLSKRELDTWSSFGPEWDQVKAAWIGRGLRYPPAGPEVEGDEQTQRGVLFQVLDARPTDLVRWITEAPDATSHGIVAHVLERWHAIRAEAGVDEDDWAKTKAEDRRTAGDAIARVGDLLSGWRS